MNIDNISLVRDTDVIPFDSVVNPISNVRYIIKLFGDEFWYSFLLKWYLC